MKSLKDVKQDMSALYDELRSGAVDLKLAAELANVAGKYLKAEQLELATAVFLENRHHRSALPHAPVAIDNGAEAA